MTEQLVFYFFSVLLLIAASAVVTVRNAVFAAFFLVLSFFSSAAIWLLLEAEFLAIVLVLVYVGAVMVLFMFVVMMLDVNLAALREGFTRYLPIGGIAVVLMCVLMVSMVTSGGFELDDSTPLRHDVDYSNTKELGYILYTKYLYPFEIAGAILLVAIIAAISLTMRKPRSNRAKNPQEQLAIKSKDRIKLVKIPAEKQD